MVIFSTPALNQRVPLPRALARALSHAGCSQE